MLNASTDNIDTTTRDLTARRQILNLLRDTKPHHVSEFTTFAKKARVFTVLRDMTQRGQVIRKGNGYYVAAGPMGRRLTIVEVVRQNIEALEDDVFAFKDVQGILPGPNVSTALRQLRDNGEVKKLAHGIYQRLPEGGIQESPEKTQARLEAFARSRPDTIFGRLTSQQKVWTAYKAAQRAIESTPAPVEATSETEETEETKIEVEEHEQEQEHLELEGDAEAVDAISMGFDGVAETGEDAQVIFRVPRSSRCVIKIPPDSVISVSVEVVD